MELNRTVYRSVAIGVILMTKKPTAVDTKERTFVDAGILMTADEMIEATKAKIATVLLKQEKKKKNAKTKREEAKKKRLEISKQKKEL
jgi:methionine-rich copper-binding protein CopC